VGAGGGSVTTEATPAQVEFGEDADRGPAGAAQRDGLVVLGLVGGGRGNPSQGDLEGLGIDHAQVGERGLDLVEAGPGEAVGAPARGLVGVQVRVRGVLPDDGGHGLSQVFLVGI